MSIINIIVYILIAVYIALLIYGIWEPYTKGTVVEAKVESIVHPSAKLNAEKYWVYIFSFREKKRQVTRIESKSFFKDKEKMTYHRGETVTIRYWFSKRNGQTRALIESDKEDRKKTYTHTFIAIWAGVMLAWAWSMINP